MVQKWSETKLEVDSFGENSVRYRYSRIERWAIFRDIFASRYDRYSMRSCLWLGVLNEVSWISMGAATTERESWERNEGPVTLTEHWLRGWANHREFFMKFHELCTSLKFVSWSHQSACQRRDITWGGDSRGNLELKFQLLPPEASKSQFCPVKKAGHTLTLF